MYVCLYIYYYLLNSIFKIYLVCLHTHNTHVFRRAQKNARGDNDTGNRQAFRKKRFRIELCPSMKSVEELEVSNTKSVSKRP